MPSKLIDFEARGRNQKELYSRLRNRTQLSRIISFLQKTSDWCNSTHDQKKRKKRYRHGVDFPYYTSCNGLFRLMAKRFFAIPNTHLKTIVFNEKTHCIVPIKRALAEAINMILMTSAFNCTRTRSGLGQAKN